MNILDLIKNTANKVFNRPKQVIPPEVKVNTQNFLNRELSTYRPQPVPNLAPKAINIQQDYANFSQPENKLGSWLDGIIKDYKAKPSNTLANSIFNNTRSALDQASTTINKVPVVGGLYKDIIYNSDNKRLFPSSSFHPENNPSTNLYTSINKYGTWQNIPKEEKKVLMADMNEKSLNLVMGATGNITSVKNPNVFRANVRQAVNLDPNLARVKLNNLLGNTADESKPLIDSLRETTPPPQGFSHSLEEMYKFSGKDVKSKVNILDYLRTPEKILQKIGLDKEAKYLRTQWDKYQAELPTEIEKIRGWAQGITPEANQRIFQRLDGKHVELKSPRELQIVVEVRDYLDDWADRLKMKKESRIGNYITHLFDDQIVSKEFDSDFAKIIKDEVPGSVYDPFLQRRTQNKLKYKEDFVEALSAYTKRALRNFNLDPALEKIKAVSPQLEESQYKYVKSYIERVNLRPTDIDSMIDNTIKSIPGIGYRLGQRPTNLITSKARQAVSRGLLGLSPITAIKNLIQGTNTYSQLGEKYTLIGYAKLAKNLPKILKGEATELEKVGVLQDSFLQDKSLSATKKLIDKVDTGLWWMFQKAEAINRGSAYWGAKAKAIAEGKTEAEAIEYAKGLVRKTQFSFGSIDTPAILQSDLSRTFLQYQSYGIKQLEFIGDMIAKKDVAGLVRYIGSTYLITSVLGGFIGMSPQESLVPSLRIGVPPTMQLPYGVAKGVLNDRNEYGQKIGWGERLWNSDVQKGLVNYIPAGNQIRRSIEGISANQNSGSYTPTGKLRYPVKPSVSNVVFGTKNSPEAESYYTAGNEFSDKQTELYKSLLSNGMNPVQAYQTIDTKRQADKAQSEKLSAYTEKPSLLTSLKDKVLGTKTPVPSLTSNGVVQNDPLLQALQRDDNDSKQTEYIKQLFGLNLPLDQIRSILEAQDISFEDAQYTMIRSLGVENGSRPELIQQMLKGLSNEEYVQQVKTLSENSILTSSVITYFEENGDITPEQADNLRKLIKQLKPNSKATKKSTGIKAKKINVSIPSIKSTPIKAPKLKITEYKPINTNTRFKPLSLPEL